jgi:hypothetical protein
MATIMTITMALSDARAMRAERKLFMLPLFFVDVEAWACFGCEVAVSEDAVCVDVVLSAKTCDE